MGRKALFNKGLRLVETTGPTAFADGVGTLGGPGVESPEQGGNPRRRCLTIREGASRNWSLREVEPRRRWSRIEPSGNRLVKEPIIAKKPSSQEAQILAEAEQVEAAVQAAVRDALIQHKRAGNPIAVWENNQVVWIPPEQIEIPDEPSTT